MAEHGHARAQNNLGNMYFAGRGVAQDNAAAVAWYRKAAEQGYAPAQYNLGYMHQSGEGVPEDHVESFAWYDLAAAQDYIDAWDRRDKLLNLMTPDQVTAAKKLSTEITARISVN